MSLQNKAENKSHSQEDLPVLEKQLVSKRRSGCGGPEDLGKTRELASSLAVSVCVSPTHVSLEERDGPELTLTISTISDTEHAFNNDAGILLY